MPTKLNYDFNTSQSAITVLLDGQEEPGSLRSAVQGFLDEREYLDCTDLMAGESLPSGYAIFEKTNDMIRRGNIYNPGIYSPGNERILFCLYLPITDLTDVWIDSFFSMCREFRESLPTDDIGSQRFLVCLRVRAGKVREEQREDILRCLRRLVTEKPDFRIQPYLLRVSGFEEFGRQEMALAILLYLLGRKDYAYFVPINNDKSLKMVDCIEYYPNQSVKTQQRLDFLKAWRTQETDPGQENLMRSVWGLFPNAFDEERAAEREFVNVQGMFGIRVDAFTGLFHNKRPEVQNNAYLRMRREEYITSKLDAIVNGVDFGLIEKCLSSYKKKDLEKLYESLENEDFHSRALEESEKQIANSLQRRHLSEIILEKCVGLCRNAIDTLPIKEQLYEEEERRLIGKRSFIVPFESLQDCLWNINDKLPIGQFGGRMPVSVRTTALVCGQIVLEWGRKGYNIRGVDNAYHCPSIAKEEIPREIVLLKECDILNLEQSDGNQSFIF